MAQICDRVGRDHHFHCHPANTRSFFQTSAWRLVFFPPEDTTLYVLCLFYYVSSPSALKLSASTGVKLLTCPILFSHLRVVDYQGLV